MIILGIETSCDETGVALYCSQRGLLAERLSSQTALHAPFGGVVPELASRDHIRQLAPLLSKVLADARINLSDLDAIAYTAGPGLIGALMVGGSFGASLAWGLNIPAIPIHHMEGHLLASMLGEPKPEFPFLALLVSGGHTQLVDVRGIGAYKILGETVDDAAGEAFDKVARLLGLPYPGGPALAELATAGRADRYQFPRPMLRKGLDFSFSGLKTAVRLCVEDATRVAPAESLDDSTRADIAASFEAAVVDTLVVKCCAALRQSGLGSLVLAGGVGANRRLRESLREIGRAEGFTVYFPPLELCTDNGAMIAYAGAQRFTATAGRVESVSARPRWPVDELTPPGQGETTGG